MNCATPVDLLEGRFQALKTADFGMVYASYHPEAPFLEHFTTREDYLAFAAQQLGGVSVSKWRTLAERQTAAGGIEVICWMHLNVGGLPQQLYELALLLPTENGWRYHSAQKLTAEEYAGPIDEIDFRHFDHAETKLRI